MWSKPGHRLVLLLLGGAVVNVAVAWGCALWSVPSQHQDAVPSPGNWPRSVGQRWPDKGVYVSVESSFGMTWIKSWAIVQHRRDPASALSRYIEMRRTASLPNAAPEVRNATDLLREIESAPAGETDQRMADVLTLLREEARLVDSAEREEIKKIILSLTERNLHFSLYVRESGWPWRCLDAESRSDTSLEPRGRHALPMTTVQSGVRLASSGRILPLRPLLGPFLLNTAFFAIIVWLVLLVPRVLTRAIRRTAGQCPDCGSDLGVESDCPACGRDVSDFWGRSSQS